MKNLWTIILTIVITAVVVGGGTYLVINSKTTKDLQQLTTQIENLKKQISNQQNVSKTESNPAVNNADKTQQPSSSTTVKKETTPTVNTTTQPNYYEQLREQCRTGWANNTQAMNSCINSVNALEKNNYKTPVNGVCDAGFEAQQALCPGCIGSCVPTK